MSDTKPNSLLSRKVAASGAILAMPALLVASALTARAVEPGGLPIGPRVASVHPDRPQTAPSAAAPAEHLDPAAQRARIDAALNKGIEYIVKSQNKDGSWGTGTETRGFEVMASVPGSHEGFRAATTALCVMALREVAEKEQAGRDARSLRQYTEAHDRGVEFLIAHGDSRRADGMLLYNTWGHIYATEALSIEIQHCTDEHLKQRLREAAQLQLKRMRQFETYVGGWNYYDFEAQTAEPSMGPTSFGTAAGLVALWQARRAGLDVPQKMIDLALHRLEECRQPNGAYLYGSDYKYTPRLPANKPQGALGRDQPCNFALWLWNDPKVDEPKVREGLEYFFKEHEFIEMGRKRQYPHESWFQTAPYYYYYDHYYAALLIEKLGDSGKAAFGDQLADVGILPNQDPDGSWWDFAMWDYHKPYGTAFAVMTLLRCR